MRTIATRRRRFLTTATRHVVKPSARASPPGGPHGALGMGRCRPAAQDRRHGGRGIHRVASGARAPGGGRGPRPGDRRPALRRPGQPGRQRRRAGARTAGLGRPDAASRRRGRPDAPGRGEAQPGPRSPRRPPAGERRGHPAAAGGRGPSRHRPRRVHVVALRVRPSHRPRVHGDGLPRAHHRLRHLEARRRAPAAPFRQPRRPLRHHPPVLLRLRPEAARRHGLQVGHREDLRAPPRRPAAGDLRRRHPGARLRLRRRRGRRADAGTDARGARADLQRRPPARPSPCATSSAP